MQPGGEQDRRIVVGVDGSASSKAALSWAVRQAKLAVPAIGPLLAHSHCRAKLVPLARRRPSVKRSCSLRPPPRCQSARGAPAHGPGTPH